MVLSALLSIGLVAVPAEKTPSEVDEKAKAAFLTGQRLYNQGQAADALVRFEEAWALRPLPVTAYNIAICEEDLKRWPEAIRWYREYLRRAPDASDKKEVLVTLVTLESTLQRGGTQALVVFTQPEDVEVEVDGEHAGQSPVVVTLKPGAHRVVAKAKGFITVERNVDLPADTSVEVSLVLPPELTSPVVRPPEVTVQTAITDESLKKLVRRERSAAPWVLLGSAAVTGVVGLGFTGAAQDVQNRFLQSPATTAGTQRDLWLSQERDFRNASFVVFGVAGAIALTALVLFIVESF